MGCVAQRRVPTGQNPLTREWFHNGRAVYHVSGDGADDFKGTLELGYEVSFPWQLGNAINFSYTTPNLNLDQTTLPGVFALPGLLVVTSPTLIPGVGINLDLGNGPGIQEVSRSRSTSQEPTARWRSPALTARSPAPRGAWFFARSRG